MPIYVGVEIVNDRDEDVPIDIPVGSIFEVDIGYGVQNVATSRPFRITMPPRSSLKAQVPGVCLNSDRGWPDANPGRITPFRYDSEQIDQKSVWERVSAPLGA